MKAVTFHGTRDVRVDTVPDPQIEHPTDAIIKITSTGICGSDLHLYEVMGASMDEGDILGHEPMGIVQEVGADVVHIKVPDGPPDERYVYLSDGLPTAWQAVEYAAVPDGGTVAVYGLGPIGQAPHAYEIFQKKQDGAIKILLQP